MNRNELFQTVKPDVKVGRTKFDLSEETWTTFDQGKLIPLYVNCDILAGDTFDVSTAFKIRSRTPLAPTLGNAKFDTYWFFVPDRIVWKHTKEFYGDSNPSAYYSPQTYQIPHIVSGQMNPTNADDFNVTQDDMTGVGSLWDYFGLPLKATAENTTDAIPISVLPARGYHAIWNTWFRDQNLQGAIFIDDGDNGYVDDFAWLDDYGDEHFDPLPACRIHDLFSSCLPAPQKGGQIFVPLVGNAPVLTAQSENTKISSYGLKFHSSTHVLDKDVYGSVLGKGESNSGNSISAVVDYDDVIATEPYSITPSNLIVDLTAVSAVGVNALRLAVASQRILERLARSGSRFEEFLASFFGIITPEAVLQIPQYLGGQTAIIQNNQVIQTSAQVAGDPLGSTGAYSLTFDKKKSFVHSFTEPGTLFCLAVVRVERTYEQNIRRMWTRTSFFDRYLEPLAFLGEMPVYTYELNYRENMDAATVFGYQEAWIHYRFGMNKTTGEMRPSYQPSAGMRHWTYTDYYDPEEDQPTLSDGWIREGTEQVDQTLAVSSELSHQFFGAFFFEIFATRPLPPRSVPGLMDHF